MNELEIKKKFKEKDETLTEDDLNEIIQVLAENDAIPKNEKELKDLFDKLNERDKFIIWDDSNDEIVSSK